MIRRDPRTHLLSLDCPVTSMETCWLHSQTARLLTQSITDFASWSPRPAFNRNGPKWLSPWQAGLCVLPSESTSHDFLLFLQSHPWLLLLQTILLNSTHSVHSSVSSLTLSCCDGLQVYASHWAVSVSDGSLGPYMLGASMLQMH